jgi:very-short-patch-repair endonuclease
MAFLLRDSEKAKQLKQEIFNTDKELYFELSSNKSILTKRKEDFCFENLKLNFPKEKIERQKRIKNYLVDFCINDKIYLEIDEQGHTGYDKEKDTIRTKTIEQETGTKLIRFNPDKQQPFELICLIAEVLK